MVGVREGNGVISLSVHSAPVHPSAHTQLNVEISKTQLLITQSATAVSHRRPSEFNEKAQSTTHWTVEHPPGRIKLRQDVPDGELQLESWAHRSYWTLHCSWHEGAVIVSLVQSTALRPQGSSAHV